MALDIKDGNNASKTLKTTLDGADLVPHHIVDNFPSGQATAANQASEIAALASILAKIIAAPATSAKQDDIITAIGAIPGGGGDATAANQATGNASLASILTKIIAAPATESKQDTLIAKDFATQATLAALLAKVIASPSTEAKQDTLIAKDFATQVTLAAVLAKIIASPATEAKQDSLLTELQLKADLTEGQPIIQGKVVFLFSTVNSTVAQLASGSTFTGGIEDITAYPSISLMCFADQDLTVTVNQFIDSGGLKIAEQQIYSLVASEKFAYSFPVNGNYIQVIVKNEGGGTTTNLQLDTAYGVIDQTNEIKDDFLRGQSAQTAVINNILTPTSGTASVDVSRYRSFTCQVVSTGTGGTFIFEGSNDGTNFQAIPVYNQALVIRVPIVTAITATASQVMYEGSCNFKYIRLRIATTITGGSLRSHCSFIHSVLGTSVQPVANGTAANFLATVSGTVTSNIGTGSLAAGTNAIGDVGIQLRANATGAASKTHLVSAATTNATIVKASAGRLAGWRITNTNAAFRYVKLHNQATTPTAGSGVVETIGCPPSQTITGGIDAGSAFTNGIGMTTVTEATDAGNTAVGAGDLIIDLFFA